MRLRNIVLKLAFIVISLALAAVGIFGWADAARAFDASSVADLDPLWPLYATGAIACLAAQVVAACATVNFARLADAPVVWRFLALAFYAAAVFFAAYSADKGAQVILTSGHRAAYEARENDRQRLEAEISTLTRLIDEERRRLPNDTSNIVTSRQQVALDAFNAATLAARTRLPEAQRELGAPTMASLPREPEQNALSAFGVFLIFLAWAILEPWGYALAERGRVAPSPQPVARSNKPERSGATVTWLRRGLALVALAWASHFATATPSEAAQVAPEPTPDGLIDIAQWQDAKAVAFAMRDRFDVPEIAAKVHRDKSTVYRWFRERDRQVAA